MRKELVEEIAEKAKQLSDEDYKKFMNYLQECIANDKEEKNKSNDKKLIDNEEA